MLATDDLFRLSFILRCEIKSCIIFPIVYTIPSGLETTILYEKLRSINLLQSKLVPLREIG